MLILKTFALQMAEFKKTQPLALAQTLNVVLETCREQRKLIGMLTQKNNQDSEIIGSLLLLQGI